MRRFHLKLFASSQVAIPEKVLAIVLKGLLEKSKGSFTSGFKPAQPGPNLRIYETTAFISGHSEFLHTSPQIGQSKNEIKLCNRTCSLKLALAAKPPPAARPPMSCTQ